MSDRRGPRVFTRSDRNNGSFGDNQETKTIKIDSGSVGKVIGEAGSRINELQKQHNVRIKINKAKNYDGTSDVEIMGRSMNDIDQATEAINSIVQNPGMERRGNQRRDDYDNNRRPHNEGRNNKDNWDNDTWDNEAAKKEVEERRHKFHKSQEESHTNSDWQDSHSHERRQDNRRYNNDSHSYERSDRSNRNTGRYGRNDNNSYGGGYGGYREPEPEVNNDEPIDWEKINKQCEEARKERWAKCPPLLKNFYKEHEEVTQMTIEEATEFRTQNMSISISRTFDPDAKIDTMPKPCPKFEHCFRDYPDLMQAIEKQGFEKPSPIQAQGWPVLLQGEDLIGIAQTGTGKTLAFLFPALIHIVSQPVPRGPAERGGPNVLVLAPTRELAIQIEMEVAKYEFRDVRAICLYGGSDRKRQIDRVKEGVEIIIATPGRLNDLVSAKYIDITSITYLVLDEADRMLDMGFEPQIRKLLLDIRPDRQTVMTSATWPIGVRRLASSYMSNPLQVFIGSLDLAATHTVTQKIEIIDEEEKYSKVMTFVKNMGPDDKCIIFCGKKDRADDLSSEFSLKGIVCQSIHGNREQADREQALADIKSGEVRILVATDVASRGIDIDDITYVVNYDFPRNIEEYVHRIGRCGRAGRSGTSLSFMTRSDWGSARELINILEEAAQLVPKELREMAERFEANKAKRDEERRAFGMDGRGGRGGGGRGGYRDRDGGHRDGGHGGRGRYDRRN